MTQPNSTPSRKFPDMEAFQAFGSNEELTEERKKAGAVVESGIMTMISRMISLLTFRSLSLAIDPSVAHPNNSFNNVLVMKMFLKNYYIS